MSWTSAENRPLPTGKTVDGAVRVRRILVACQPAIVGLLVLSMWEVVVRSQGVPVYVLPTPSAIALSLIDNWWSLLASLRITLTVTAGALAGAVIIGLATSVVFAQFRFVERSFFPYAVIMQVTPVVAIAPLIIIWIKQPFWALLVCAWLVAFFPVVSNTTVGLKSHDRNLLDLFKIIGATPMQTLIRLKLPSAMPYFLAGVRISGGLALIGSVVAEFVTGTGGSQSGLAFRILESGYQLNIPKMFAALLLISLAGVAIYLALSLVTHVVLGHWHESAGAKEN